MRILVAAIGLLTCAACERPGKPQPSITVAAASNLSNAFDEIGQAFTRETGIRVVYSFGSTAQLARQIENAAPFDLFAAADTQHVDDLLRSGKLRAGSRAVYAVGQLAVWVPGKALAAVRKLEDLADPTVRSVAIATPGVAPYGKAAVEALQAAGMWAKVEPKVVYAGNIAMAKQYAASGNAEAAFTAYSLVLREAGTVFRVDEKLYTPIAQALAVVAASRNGEAAGRFASYVLGAEGSAILGRYGYKLP